MTQFHELPEEKTFGHSFNYAVWGANTTVTLANVPWNSDYRDIVRFPGNWAGGLDNYIDNGTGPVITTTGVTYAALGRPIKLDIPFERANTFNYLRAHNPAQPIPGGDTGRSYYYFVVGVNYVAPNTTQLMLQLDVWQSFGPTAEFGNCYVERGHVGIANENNFDHYGRDYLTTPEGFDLGNEYEIRRQYALSVGSARFEAFAGIPDYSVLVASSTGLDEDPGTVDAPKLTSAKGSEMENLPNGAEIYLFNNLDHFKMFMEAMKDKPWVTQGIMSIQAVPRLARYGVNTTSKFIAGSIPVDTVESGPLKNIKSPLGLNWRQQIDLGRYWRLAKFATYPYMVLEMTSYTGTPLVLKPECWQNDHMDVVEVPHFAPPNARLGFYPYRYNVADGAAEYADTNGVINDGGEFLNMMTGIMNFPAFSVVNNGYMQFMANNQAGIAFQHSSADWSQQRALTAASTSYDQASAGISTSQDISGQGIGAANAQTKLSMDTMRSQGFQAAGNATVNGFRNLDPAGMAIGVANAAVNYAINTNQANQGNAISTGLAAGVNRAQTDNMGYIRDTNQALAQFSANGDYANAIAGINAKVQDAKMTQPTTAGQVGGDAFNLSVYRWGVEIKIKMLQPSVMAAIGEFWLRYGYAVNRFTRMPASFMVMEKFTYWKLKEVYVTSADCPETFKQTLRGIFEKGVTVWSNPADIGNIDTAENDPLPGVTL